MKKTLSIFISSILGLVILICLLFGYRDVPIDELVDKYGQAPSAFIELDGMKVHYRDEGNRQDTLPIVLIHGTGASLHTFDEWTDVLQRSRRVIRMDLPAFGLTGPFPDRDYSIEHYVDFMQSFLVAIGIEKCILGGNSLGGHIAWRFTLVRPEMVDRLILIDAAGYPINSKSEPLAFKMAKMPMMNKVLTYITPRSVVRSSVRNVYADSEKISDALVDRYFDLSLRAGNRQAFVDRMTVVYDSSYVKQISRIQQKTLVLWGEQDALITTESAYRFHEDLAYDTLVILKNSGHVPMEESPVQSLEPVLSFLKK